jgi:hypothetical protein
MRKAVFVIAILVPLAGAVVPSRASTLVYLMGGQSNMDGYGVSAELPVMYSAPQTGVKFWKNNTWVNLQGGFGSSTAGFAAFGPEVSFGRQMSAMFPDDDIYLVKYAIGGTALADPANEWTPNGSGWVYNAFKANANAALKNLGDAGLSPKLAGMLWMQGEADASPGYAPAYATNLANFIGKVRSDLATPNMPFVLGRIMSYSQYPFGSPSDNALVRTAQTTVPTQLANVSWVDTDHLPVNPQGAGWAGHYNTQGQLGLGLLFADKFITAPEPGTLVLIVIGLLGVLVNGLRRRLCAFGRK